MSKDGNVDFLDKLFVDVNDVIWGLVDCDKPFITSVSLFSVDVSKLLCGSELDSKLTAQEVGILDSAVLLIDFWEIVSFSADQPFFTSVSLNAINVNKVVSCSELECLLWQNYFSLNLDNNLQ